MKNLVLSVLQSETNYWGTPSYPTTDGDGAGRGILCRKQS